jgi:hypothetical protein
MKECYCHICGEKLEGYHDYDDRFCDKDECQQEARSTEREE